MPTTDDITPDENLRLAEMEAELAPNLSPERQSKPLFHCTCPEAFLKIVESGKLWATHFRYLNDREEILHGERIIEDVAVRHLAAGVESPIAKLFFEKFVELFPRLKVSERIKVCVASLSEDGDQLSQWRAYGGDGSGYAIGFASFPSPPEDNPDAKAGVALLPCRYQQDVFRRDARDILLSVVSTAERYIQQHARREQAADAFLRRAVEFAYRWAAIEVARFKHEAFEAEHEWRFIVVPRLRRDHEAILYRVGQDSIIPYFPIPLGFDDNRNLMKIHRIVVGPGRNADRAKLAAEMLLSSRGYDPNGVVVSSRIPYRGSR